MFDILILIFTTSFEILSNNLYWPSNVSFAKQFPFCQTYTLSVTTITTIIESLEVANEDHGVKGLKRSLKASMEARFSAVEAYEHFTIASFLDVKYIDQFNGFMVDITKMVYFGKKEHV